MNPSIRRALIACGAAVTLTACSSTVSGQGSGALPAGGPSSSGPVTGSSGPTGTAPVGSGNAALSAAELEHAAKAAFTSASSFQVTGTGSDGSVAVTFSMHYGESSSRGTVTLNGQRVQLLNSGPDIYIMGSRRFWTHFAGAPAAAVSLLQGKWVDIPADGPGLSELADIAVREKFLTKAAESPDTSTYTKGPAKTINGIPAVSFVSNDGSTIYVRAQGTPYPIRIEDHIDSGETFDLSAWNVPFTAAPPPSDQIIELPH
jgi:hypothetical protein